MTFFTAELHVKKQVLTQPTLSGQTAGWSTWWALLSIPLERPENQVRCTILPHIPPNQSQLEKGRTDSERGKKGRKHIPKEQSTASIQKRRNHELTIVVSTYFFHYLFKQCFFFNLRYSFNNFLFQSCYTSVHVSCMHVCLSAFGHWHSHGVGAFLNLPHGHILFINILGKKVPKGRVCTHTTSSAAMHAQSLVCQTQHPAWPIKQLNSQHHPFATYCTLLSQLFWHLCSFIYFFSVSVYWPYQKQFA